MHAWNGIISNIQKAIVWIIETSLRNRSLATVVPEKKKHMKYNTLFTTCTSKGEE